MDASDPERERWNATRIAPPTARGGYESWFLRANDPDRPRAFWIRYTIFAPRDRPEAALGELWAVWFDGERDEVIATRQEHPLASCSFAPDRLLGRIGAAHLRAGTLEGRASGHDHAIGWSLRYGGGGAPLLLLPERMYAGGFPKAKALVPAPLARFDGNLDVDGEAIGIDGWVGSQNHNWGSEHTARYAWGQVAGFDDAPDAFLEVSSARVRVGPLLTPTMTVLVLRLGGEELRCSSILRALTARAHVAPFEWRFETGTRGARISGTITAPARAFVALPYLDPPGRTKNCLNSKLASCTLRVERRGEPTRVLRTVSRAAFELLSDDPAPPGVRRLAG